MNCLSRTVFQTTVFSDGPGGGNPCPVVLDADALTTELGMSFATRFMAETVLVTSATSSQAQFGLRYFVPRHEMEMCVHGTIAAVAVLHSLDRIASSPVRIETVLGLISVDWSENKEGLVVTVDQFAPEFAARNPIAQEVAKVLRLSDSSLIRTDLPIMSVSTSRSKLIVPLLSEQALNSLYPDFDELWSLCDKYCTTGLYAFAVSESEPFSFAARQFPKRAGYCEDPATGVAACALGAYLTRFHAQREGWSKFEILQGQAMGNPSRIVVKTLLKGGLIRKVYAEGQAEILDCLKISDVNAGTAN